MKIALVGAEPASQGLAPWEDDSFKIWTCSVKGLEVPRSDIHFEIHNIPVMSGRVPEVPKYIEKLAKHPHVLLAQPFPQLPNGKLLDINPLIERFGPYFLTSTPAIMFAKAIYDIELWRLENKGREEEALIALFGIDMTDEQERITERTGVQFYIQKAEETNPPIKIVAPFESDILAPPPIYGFCEFDNHFRKRLVRRDHARRELAEVTKRLSRDQQAAAALQAYIDVENYSLSIWGGAKCSDQ